MNRRRQLLLGAAALPLLTMARQAGAQTAERLPRVGVLRPSPATDPQYQGFLAGLHELGHVEGRTLQLDYVQGTLQELPALAAELVRRPCDLIFAPAPQAAQAVRAASSSVPIVFAAVGDAVSAGLARSLGNPGLNATGLTSLGFSQSARRLVLLREMLPRLSRVAVLWNPDVVDKLAEFRETQPAAARLKIGLQSNEVRAPADFEVAFERMRRTRMQAMITLGEPLTFSQLDRILDFQREHRIAGIFSWRRAVEAGGLVAYGPDLTDLYRRAATYVDRILRGAAPGSLPIEAPTRFEFAVNTVTARALGITVPQAMLARADPVI